MIFYSNAEDFVYKALGVERDYEFFCLLLQVCVTGDTHFRGDPATEETAYTVETLRKCRKNNIEVVSLINHGNVDSSESL